MTNPREPQPGRLRVGQAAEMLGVSVETLRRWEADGRLRMTGPRAASDSSTIDDVSRLLDERRRAATDRPIVAQSARNRFPGSSRGSSATGSPLSSRSSPARTGWSA